MGDYWTYRASPVHVVDGDTVDFKFDLGFDVHKHVRIRLARVDTAEIYGTKKYSDEWKLGKKQQAFVQEWFDAASGLKWPARIDTFKGRRDMYGRYIGDVERRTDGANLSDDLTEEWPEVAE